MKIKMKLFLYKIIKDSEIVEKKHDLNYIIEYKLKERKKKFK